MRINDKLGMIAVAGSKDWHDANFQIASATWRTIERVDDSDLFQTKLTSGQTLVVSFDLDRGASIPILSLLNPFGPGFPRFRLTFELDQVPFGPLRDTKEISSGVVRQTIEDLMMTLTPLARQRYLEIKEDAKRNQVKRDRRLEVEQAEALRKANAANKSEPLK